MAGKKQKDSGKVKALAEKKLKQANKALKKASKKSKSNGPGDEVDEDDLETLLQEFKQKDFKQTEVEIVALQAPPSARNYFSIVDTYKNNEILMFGGEFFDGDNAVCYNDLFRYNYEKNEWKQYFCPNMPPPRCSHQAVCLREKSKVYIFGGEFSTAYSFYHHRDLWELDLETNMFRNIVTKTGPSARSGHRMVLFKHYLILFGGFYETSRGCNFFNDVHFFNLRTENWFVDEETANAKALALTAASTSNKPLPRSSCQLMVDTSANSGKGCIYMYGGYSKVKTRGKNLDDLWQLNINFLAEEKVELKWEKLNNKGLTLPGKRSGCAGTQFKNKFFLFGGVEDNETANDLEGEFFNDVFSYDLQRKRWFELEINKSSAEGSAPKARKRRVKDSNTNPDDDGATQFETVPDDGEEVSSDDEFNDIEDFDENAFYYIENGKLVKADMDVEDSPDPLKDIGLSDNNDAKPSDTVLEMEPEASPTATSAAPVEELEDIGGNPKASDSNVVRTVDELPEPMGRIGAGTLVVNNFLYVFFGTCEVADYHICFDDIWRVNVTKKSVWEPIHKGNWEAEAEKANALNNHDEDAASDESEDGLEEQLEEATQNAELLTLTHRGDEDDMKHVLENLKALRKHVESFAAIDGLVPEIRENLKEFFKRTGKSWVEKYASTLDVDEQADGKYQLSGKELRRKAFDLCEDRFVELAETLEQLDQLQEEQIEAEKFALKQMKIEQIKANGGKVKKDKKVIVDAKSKGKNN